MPPLPSSPAREMIEKAAETTSRVLDQVRALTDVTGRHAATFMPPSPSPAAAEATKELAARFARTPAALAQDAQAYATDAMQRLTLFWDVMREAGNNFVEHERAGCPPVLVFDYETVVDGRTLPRPVNYALVRSKAGALPTAEAHFINVAASYWALEHAALSLRYAKLVNRTDGKVDDGIPERDAVYATLRLVL